MRKDVGSCTTSRVSRASLRAPAAARVSTLETSSDESDPEPKKTKKTTHCLEKGKFVPKKDRVVELTDSLTDRLSRADPIRALVDETVAQLTKRQERRTTPRAMEPVEQDNPKSYIGLALKRLGKGKGPASSLESSSSTSSASGDSSSDLDSSTSSGSDSDDSSSLLSSSSSLSSGRRRHRRRNRSKGNRCNGRSRRASKKCSRKARKRRQKRMTLKPIPPTKYDGSMDSKAFHHFITEGTAYVKDGRVPSTHACLHFVALPDREGT